MSFTDREYLKMQQAGALGTTGATNNIVEVGRAHTRSHDFPKVGTENAATNVAETIFVSVPYKSLTKAVKYLTATNVAASVTDYAVITVSKRVNSATAVTIATYNTHPSAQGAITQYVPASFSVVTNSDAQVAAGLGLTYSIGKIGAGQAVAIGTLSVDLEEV